MATKKKAAAKKKAVQPKPAKKAAAKKAIKKAAPKKAPAKKTAPKKAVPKAAKKTATVKPKAKNAAKLLKKKPKLKRQALAIQNLEAMPAGIDIQVTFKDASGGLLTATLFRSTGNETGQVTSTGTISFDNVVKGDAISLNGNCAGTTIINANRKVRTGSGKPLPLSIPGTILESLDILQ